MKKPKIAIMLGSKFPTQKAYGITTLYTLTSIIKKNESIRIFCLKSDYQDTDFKEAVKYITNFRLRTVPYLLINFAYKNTKTANKVFFRLGLFMMLIDNFRLITNFGPEIIWVRDPFIAFIARIISPNSRIILEVHSPDSMFFLKLLMKFSNHVNLFPINNSNLMIIQKIKPEMKLSLAPMAIDIKNLPSQKEVTIFLNKLFSKQMHNLNIGYVGNVSPQGYSKGVEDLISLAKFNQYLGNGNEVNLVGCTYEQIKYYSNLQLDLNISTTYLKFLPHVNHTAALKIMKNFDILVLPMPFDKSYNGMPLKLLEYLSSGRITIMAESSLLKSIFGSGYKPYWYLSGDGNDLYEKIITAIQDKNLQDNIQQGLEFARQFSWEVRTSNILKSINVEF